MVVLGVAFVEIRSLVEPCRPDRHQPAFRYV